MVYLWSDAWLLQSIVLASSDAPATLAQVIGAADAVNHALLTDDELHGGLSRLTTGGVVVETNGRFAVTSLVPAATITTIRTSGWQRGRQIAAKFLDAEEWTWQRNVRDPRNAVRYESLTAERIDEAEREYRRHFQKAMKDHQP